MNLNTFKRFGKAALALFLTVSMVASFAWTAAAASIPAYENENISVALAGYTVQVTASNDAITEPTRVAMTIVKESAVGNITVDDVAYVKEITTTDGTISYSFDMHPDIETDTYLIYFSGTNLTKSAGFPFAYYDDNALSETIDALRNAADESEVAAILEDPEKADQLAASGLLMEEYEALTGNQQAAVRKSFVSDPNRKDAATSSVARAFNASVATAKINELTSAEDVSDMMLQYAQEDSLLYNALDLVLDAESGKSFAALKEASNQTAYNWVLDQIMTKSGEFENGPDIEELYHSAHALYLVNQANKNILADVLSPVYMKDALGLNEDAWETYVDYIEAQDEDALLAIAEEIMLSLSGEETDTSHVASVFQSAVNGYDPSDDEPEEDGSSPSTGGGGSRPSTSTGGGTTVRLPNGGSTTPETDEREFPFVDCEAYDWAKEPILALYDLGAINGVNETEFNPQGNVTREEFIKMLVGAFGLLDESATARFVDVNRAAWYYTAVASAQSLGITNGMGDGSFGVGRLITREEMATMVYRAADKCGVTLKTDVAAPVFTDQDAISSYAVESVDAMARAGIINGYGDGRFIPAANASRAEAAKVIYGLLQQKQ